MTKQAVITAALMVCAYWRPGVEEESGKAHEDHRAVLRARVAGRVLHPRTGGDDEVAREPRAQEDECGGEPVPPAPEPPLAEEEEGQEGRLEEEGEDAFHGERLADDATGRAREARPIGPELELERDARHDAHGEVDRDAAPPEARGAVVVRLAGPERARLEDRGAEREPQGQGGEA